MRVGWAQVQQLDVSHAPLNVAFIRHGEKPGEHGAPHGVNHHGEHDPHSLSVRGWTRAGGLASLFAQVPTAQHPSLVVPQRIIATKPSAEAKSRREYDTATPLARRLDVVIEDDLQHGDEAAVCAAVLGDARDTLVVWHHGALSELLRCFPISNLNDVPKSWPEKRFDLIWALHRDADDVEFTFAAMDQALLSGDAGAQGTVV